MGKLFVQKIIKTDVRMSLRLISCELKYQTMQLFDCITKPTINLVSRGQTFSAQALID